MSWVKHGSQCTGTTSFLVAPHVWVKHRNGHYVCSNRGCSDKLKEDKHPDFKPKKGPEYDSNAKRTDLMLGKVPGTIKGGKWGNKADKDASSQMHRQNPPKTEGEKAGENKGCFEDAAKGAAVILITLGALGYGAYEGISSLLT